MMTVSKQTESFVECITAMHELYNKVNDALYDMYGEEADRIMDNDFVEEFDALKSRIERFMLMSINEKISIVDLFEI